MIVKRYWGTDKDCHGHYWKAWCGYFLFGFIPLYVSQIKNENVR